MGKNVIRLSVFLFVGMIASTSFASGFKCEGEDGYKVKLFNHVNPENGTRVPSAMIISSRSEGTLLVRKGEEITKTNRLNTVRYTVDGNRKLAADTAILQIRFKEGKEVLAAGEEADGQLILVTDDGREVLDLVCERYLKNDEE